MGKLPQEVIDEVIGSIDDTEPNGHPALLACSRVCRSWQRQAQKELFSFVNFTNLEQLRRWERNISLDSEIPSYVRHLSWVAVALYNEEAPDPFLENEFPGCFASFSNLQSLLILSFSLRPLDSDAIERIFGHLGHSLHSLRFNTLTTDLEKLCLLVSLLPNLRYLYLPTVHMSEDAPRPSQENPLSFNFTGTLAPYNPGLERLFRCVAGLRPRFGSINIGGIDHPSVEALNLVLKNCSTTVTAISITPVFLGTEGNLMSVCWALYLANCL